MLCLAFPVEVSGSPLSGILVCMHGFLLLVATNTQIADGDASPAIGCSRHDTINRLSESCCIVRSDGAGPLDHQHLDSATQVHNSRVSKVASTLPHALERVKLQSRRR